MPGRRLKSEELVRVHSEAVEALHPYLKFLTELPTMSRSERVVFCHAGVNPKKPMDAQSRRALLWGHPHFLVDDPVPGMRIVHGHYAEDAVVSTSGRLGLDTGAYYSGVLTAARLDADETIFQTGN